MPKDEVKREIGKSSWQLRSACIAAAIAGLAGCVSYLEVPVIPSASQDAALYHPSIEGTYHVAVGDVLAVRSYYDSNLSQEVTVRPDGQVSLLLIGDQHVAGKTLGEISSEFKKAYANYLNSPDITVSLKESPGESIYFGGEVGKPGLEPMKSHMTLMQGVIVAGGFLPSADATQVLLLRRQVPGQYKIFKFNAQDVLVNKNSDIYLKRHDIVYVPRKGIADMDIFVDQYLSKLIPQWLRYNLNYQVNTSTVTVTPK